MADFFGILKNKLKIHFLLHFKAIGGVNQIFYKLIFFNRVFTEFQVAFYRFQKFKLVFEI